jgi:hypothetical protein
VIGVINLFITRSLVRDEGAATPSPAQMRVRRGGMPRQPSPDRAARADRASLKEASR